MSEHLFSQFQTHILSINYDLFRYRALTLRLFAIDIHK